MNELLKETDTASSHEYLEFLNKFEVKKTTDDCYTPPEAYDIVVDYVRDNYDLTGKKILRPFYPGGDYENEEYTDNCVVIDNPSFSIISKIARFYIERNIKFFLFAPHLTLFSSDIDCTHIVVGCDVTYTNGAKVKTSFLSNMFNDTKIIGEPKLLNKFKELNESKKVNLPSYQYPDSILTVSMVQYIINNGISVKIGKKDVKHCRGLESQKKHKKGIFGSGFLLSTIATKEKAAAEKAAAEKAAAEKKNVQVWELSEKEEKIITELDNCI
ncbi:chromosome partitioning protein ParB [Elizabethkingia meningoseptica]|uniref:chromosome partitioning protein ParB n=1 Tax=Elizabethkingia meningoseptica TaxID=238 RepID=UPI0023AF299F|nr:chromosome partitioning protein ParB [Elizabethkingia meningoseptica]MDE5507742.1 chromosome partitioning protein ParB [Elizabethkingia meningoseptica]